MKILNIISSLLFVLSIIIIFFNWKIAIALFLVTSIIHVIPKGPNLLLSTITGYLMIGGVIYLFINWKIGLALIVCSLAVAKFRSYGNKCNHDYEKNKNSSKDK
jgi:hypothetical protein